jgi:myo-inositol 2-dehydrogenase/D-chiro-inositol 1-dehydrogenase
MQGNQTNQDRPTTPSRRNFMKGTTAAALGAAIATYSMPRGVYAAENNTIKIGLIGCGGRGGGATVNALKADPNIELVAIGDMFKDKADGKLEQLKATEVGDRVKVAPDHIFHGWDAYKSVIAAVDVVLLATPPHFRPLHLRAAVDAGKHVFCEKPVGVDVPGVKKVIEACKVAQEKNLSILSGLCYRYDEAKKDTVDRIHNGAVGDIIALQGMYLTSGLWMNPRQADWSDMEWQLRNWLYFTWLSGDHIVEQHIHTLDKALWVMKNEPPVKATSNGGRTVRTGPQFGHIYDHFDTIFEWENGTRAFCQTRQWDNCESDVSDWVFGTEGKSNLMQHSITGKNAWRRRASPVNMYDAEHVVLFKAIRDNKPINNGDYMTKATLMGIMGRNAAYTGKTIKWDQLMESTMDLTPAKYAFGPLPTPEVAVPGVYKFS